MKKLLLIFLAALLTFACAGCGAQDDKGASPDEVPALTETPEEELETFEIKTDYCTLKYPVKYKDKVTVTIDKGNPYTVKFTCDKTPLFDLYFNGGDGDLLGTILGKDGNTILRAKTYDIDKSAKNRSELLAMSGLLNLMLDYLDKDYGFERGVEAYDTEKVYEIETPVVKLYYPAVWKDSVTVKADEKAARFTAGDVKLFDLEFGDSEGDYVGSYDGKNIYVVTYDIEKGSLSDGDYTKLLGMQDGLNTVLDHLKQEEKFK